MVFDLLAMIKVTYVATLFEIEVKKIDFINVKQFLENECSITLGTLENK